MKQLLIFVACLVGLSGTRLLGQDLVWVKQLPGVGSDYNLAIIMDNAGNSISTGTFGGTVDFDPGPGVYNLNATNGGGFLRKFDPNGNFVSVIQFGGMGWGLEMDAAGNFLISGEFSGTKDFDPGVGTFMLTSAGNADIFVLKLDGSGNFLWAKQFGAASNDRSYHLAIDPSNNVIVTGEFYGTVDFDPGMGTSNVTSGIGSTDCFILKLNEFGDFVWAIGFGGINNDRGYGICVDNNHDIYATGYFSGTADFDPGVGVANLTASGNNTDVFVLKITGSGNYAWANSFGAPSADDEGRDLLLDQNGNIQVAGSIHGTADFDPGTNVSSFTGTGYVVEYDGSNGNFVSAFCFPEGNVIVHSFAIDEVGNRYLAGNFAGNGLIDFDPGPGICSFKALGINDVFVAKIDKQILAGQFEGGQHIRKYLN